MSSFPKIFNGKISALVTVVNWKLMLLSSVKIQANFFPLPIRGEDGCFLYGVFNGYDGSRVASFASQCLTAELLLGQINSSHTDNDIRRILSQVFPNLNDRTFTLVIPVMYVKRHS